MDDIMTKFIFAITGIYILFVLFLKFWNTIKKKYERKEKPNQIEELKEQQKIIEKQQKENIQAIIREAERRKKERESRLNSYDLERFAIECNAHVVKKEREEERLEKENKTNV